ncbi:CU044_5270 family protein [Krasilnikovia sp. MM14-A1004]|uniref:CU044_5270 family protein n=1 Tax=Krasilnikovia sp. MM14-A1004 TaxID=3373541 RepID=UPI00399CDEE5
MNQSGPDAAERADLTRLLPPPGDPELPADRHRLLKDAFMQQISEHPAAARPRRRFLLMAAPVAAAVLVAAIVATTVFNRHTAAAITSPTVAVAAGDASKVAPLMERVALVAGRKPPVPVGKDEYVYIKSRTAGLVFSEDNKSGHWEAGVDPQVLGPLHLREIWVPAAQGTEGLIREDDDTFGLDGATPNSRYADLPTDPAALLDKIYADTKGMGTGPDAEAFDFIGTALRESLLPPQVTAALYRAAAKIPGVVLVPDSVDAEGRHGVAIGRTDELGERREWIFNATTLDYLGERSYLVRDTATGKAGMLTGTTAVLERGVVHRQGDVPR